VREHTQDCRLLRHSQLTSQRSPFRAHRVHVACPSTAGTLRDQLIYPDSKEEMLAKGVSDTDLMQLLSLVDPPGIIVDRWTFDTEANWSLTLSGGQKQRVAMARLFYHQPK